MLLTVDRPSAIGNRPSATAHRRSSEVTPMVHHPSPVSAHRPLFGGRERERERIQFTDCCYALCWQPLHSFVVEFCILLVLTYSLSSPSLGVLKLLIGIGRQSCDCLPTTNNYCTAQHALQVLLHVARASRCGSCAASWSSRARCGRLSAFDRSSHY